MACPQESSAENCPCTYTSCERRGACCQCISYHRSKNQMVACYFKPEVERTYNRSMEAFLAQYQ